MTRYSNKQKLEEEVSSLEQAFIKSLRKTLFSDPSSLCMSIGSSVFLRKRSPPLVKASVYYIVRIRTWDNTLSFIK